MTCLRAWKDKFSWSREGQRGRKERSRHQTAEDKSQIMKGLVCIIQVLGFYQTNRRNGLWKALHAEVKWSDLCFRIFWKQAEKFNLSGLRLSRKTLRRWKVYSVGQQFSLNLGRSCAMRITLQVWGRDSAMEFGIIGSGQFGKRDFQFEYKLDIAQQFMDRNVLSIQPLLFILWKICQHEHIVESSSLSWHFCISSSIATQCAWQSY